MLARDAALHWILAGLIGAAIGFTFASAFKAPEPIRAIEPGLRAPTAIEQRGSGGDSSMLAESGPSGRAPTTSSNTGFSLSDMALDRAVAAVEAPLLASAAEGTGRINGLVTDRRGAPLPGVAILVEARKSSSANLSDPLELGRGTFEDDDLDTTLRASATAWAQRRGAKRLVQTGADGRFVIDELDAQSDYSLMARLAGYTVQGVGEMWAVRVGADVRFIGYAVAVVRVDLVDEAGERLQDGAISVVRGRSTTNYAWTPEKSELRLEAGAIELRAYADLDPTWSPNYRTIDSDRVSAATTLRLDEREERAVVLTVLPRVGVRCNVVMPGGLSPARLGARLLPLPSGLDYSDELMAESETSSRWNSSTFSFLDLSPGRYAVGVLDQQSAVLGHMEVVLVDRLVDVDLLIQPPPPEQVLVVRALDPRGEPLIGLSVSYTAQSANSSSSSSLVPLSWDNGVGTFVLPKPVLDGEKETGKYVTHIKATHSVYGDVEADLERLQRQVLLQFEEPVGIDVVVEGLAATGLTGRLSISVDKIKESAGVDDNWYGNNNQKPVPTDGRLSYPMLAPGRYKVELRLGRDVWNSSVVESREVDASTGTTVVTFAAPILYAVRVVAPTLAVGTSVWLALYVDASDKDQFRGMRRGGAFSAITDASGRAQFDEVPAGEYTVGANGATASMRIKVPCADVLFDARETDALRVTISDIEGLLHKAGLRSGDLLIAVNGNDPHSATQLQQTFNAAPDAQVLDVTVVRAGASQTFTLPVSETPRRRALGGSLRPAMREQ